MHRTRFFAALASVSLVVGVAACGDDDDAGGDETVPALTADEAAETTPAADTTAAAETTVGAETTAAAATTAVETTVPETTAVETTEAPATTAVESTVSEATAVETTLVETTAVETTEPPETTAAETTVPETTAVETTVTETTVVETTEAPETTAAPETTTVETTLVETTEVPETTAVETTVPETTAVETTLVETTVAETTEVPETTAVETTLVETTVVDTTEAADTTVAGSVPGSIPAIPEVLPLSGEGLGLVTFGDDPDAAIAAVTEVLGAPTEDTGWADPLSISACPGTQVRRVSWGALSLFFGDESPIESGTPHLFAYSYGSADDLEAEPIGLATDDGIGLGSTVAYLKAAYPDVVIEPGEDGVIEPSFFVDDTLSGRLTGGEDDDLVTVIIGGDPCGV